MLKIAQMGIVAIQDKRISLRVLRLRARIPLANPTPSTDPTRAWVVEMGRPIFDARRMVSPAPNSAQKPREGVSSVIFLPMVSMTLQPQVASPATMPVPPKMRSHKGTDAAPSIVFVFKTEKTAATGPMALATSFAPWAKATKQALIICK